MLIEFTSSASALFFWGSVCGVFLGSLMLSWGVLRVFPRWGLMDNPQKYGHERDPIPYPGGVVIGILFVVSVVLLFPISVQMLGFLIGVMVLMVLSFADDRWGVHPLIRFAVQIGIGVLLVMTGTKIVFLGNPFGAEAFELSPFVSGVVTIGWVIAMINTVNWLDGVPGAAAGTSVVAGIFLGMLCLTPLVDQPELARMCFLFAAVNGGFVVFNIAPPKMLNGDTGAMVSGLIIAVLSIFSGGKMATAFLVLALPIFDAVCVTFHRLREKKSPFRGGDKRHLHDQLLLRGWSERQIFFLFLLVSGVLGISALYLQTFGKLSLLLVLGMTLFILSWRTYEGKK